MAKNKTKEEIKKDSTLHISVCHDEIFEEEESKILSQELKEAYQESIQLQERLKLNML
jgi:hypothetical protein